MQNVKKWIAAVLSLALTLALALSSTAFAAVDDTGYSDVDAGNPYAEAILYCREHELMGALAGTASIPTARSPGRRWPRCSIGWRASPR